MAQWRRRIARGERDNWLHSSDLLHCSRHSLLGDWDFRLRARIGNRLYRCVIWGRRGDRRFPYFYDLEIWRNILTSVNWIIYLITHLQLGFPLLSKDVLLMSINYLGRDIIRRARMNRIGSPHLIMTCQNFLTLSISTFFAIIPRFVPSPTLLTRQQWIFQCYNIPLPIICFPVYNFPSSE